MSLAEAARILGLPAPTSGLEFAGVSTDTRSLEAGNLFVALSGPHHDGHRFLTQARERGAAAALVARPPAGELPQLVVTDTLVALSQLAAAWRVRFDLPLVAVLGSNGKTTVKEMLAAVLQPLGPLLVTRGNLNNHIGVPLTLLRLSPWERMAVIEMGANHPSEIGPLAELARPRVALITNAGLDHLEGFGSMEGAARANGEVFGAMQSDGVAVLNGDDPCFPLWRELADSRPVVRFGLESEAEIRGHWRPRGQGGRLELETGQGGFAVDLALAGRHNAANALAAAATALVLGAEPAHIQAGLAAIRAVPGRLQFIAGAAGATLIDDSYNANPSSLEAALEVLAAQPGQRILVLGDMAELGRDAAAWHERAGELARERGVEWLYGLGELSRSAVDAFGPGAEHFTDQQALLAGLGRRLGSDVHILIKGSRCMHMERIRDGLAADEGRLEER